jgi:hypothetical protein
MIVLDEVVMLVVMPGLVPPAGPKPLRRGEGPGIYVFSCDAKDSRSIDAKDSRSMISSPLSVSNPSRPSDQPFATA